MAHPLYIHYPRGKSPCHPLDRRLGGPQSRSGRRGEEELLILPALELGPLGRPARSQSLYITFNVDIGNVQNVS
jgi:hypothetical protein